MLKSISTKEKILYSISLAIMITGLVFIILGIVGNYLPASYALSKIQESFSWRWIGLIIFACGALFGVICLLVFAKKVDRVTEREIRRKQRLSAMMSDVENKEETVVINKDELKK